MKLSTYSNLLKRLLFVALLSVAIFGARSAQANVATEEMKIDLDAVGDATVTITEHYSAVGWLNWKDDVGDHPDLVVRNKKREYAAWEVYDFSFSKDEVARVAESKMKVRAFAQISHSGDYVLDKLPTGLHLVTNNGNEWIFGARTGDAADDDEMDVTIHVNLPRGAFNAHVVNPDSSHTELVYSVASHGTKFSKVLLMAIFLAVLGVLILGISWTLPETLGEAPQFLAIRKIVAPSCCSVAPGSGSWRGARRRGLHCGSI